jgi:hypothetical protein
VARRLGDPPRHFALYFLPGGWLGSAGVSARLQHAFRVLGQLVEHIVGNRMPGPLERVTNPAPEVDRHRDALP